VYKIAIHEGVEVILVSCQEPGPQLSGIDNLCKEENMNRIRGERTCQVEGLHRLSLQMVIQNRNQQTPLSRKHTAYNQLPIFFLPCCDEDASSVQIQEKDGDNNNKSFAAR
jgi:hypothetical protein